MGNISDPLLKKGQLTDIATETHHLIASGVKEKYVFQKMGLPFRQMHSWDYSGPYHGYDGFAIFARDMDLALNSPTWGLIGAPWNKSAKKALRKATAAV